MIRGVVAVVLMVMTSSAWAFECTKTDDGLESIRWPSSPVAVAMLAPGPATTSASVASAAFEGAVAAWNAPACSSIELRLQGVISLPSDAEGQGHIAFISNNWPHSPDALSIPTMTFHLETGAIRNGKVEINEANFRFANADATCPMGDEYDLQSALTHDLGHFLGLGHPTMVTEGPDAPTMSPRLPECDSNFRTLEADDVAGLCFIYPANGEPQSCVNPDDGGCSCSETPAAGTGWWLLLCIAAGAALRRRPSAG